MDCMMVRLLRPVVRASLAAAVAAFVAPAFGADAPAPPQLQAAPPAKPAAAATSDPRRVIRAPEPAPEPAPPPAKPASAPGGVVQWHGEPSPDEQLPPAGPVLNETRIEQKRQANRIVEVIVTPAGSTHSYVMLNQEGQRPRTFQDIGGTGLSLPQFLRIPVK